MQLSFIQRGREHCRKQRRKGPALSQIKAWINEHLFLEGSRSAIKKLPWKPRKCSLWRATNVLFSKFSTWKIHVWTVGQSLDLLREDSESDIGPVQKQIMFQKGIHVTLPHLGVDDMELSRFEHSPWILEPSIGAEELKFARAFNSILHSPWRIWKRVCV